MWNVLLLSRKINPLKRFNLFFRGSLLRNWAFKTDDCSRKFVQFRLNFLWPKQSKGTNVGLFGINLFQIINCVFVPAFSDFNDYLWLLLEKSSLKNLWPVQSLGGNSVWCSGIRFILSKTMNKFISTRNRVFISLVGCSETGKSQLVYKWLKNGTFQPKWQNLLFFQHSQSLFDVIQNEIDNFEFVQGVNFEFVASLKNNSTNVC